MTNMAFLLLCSLFNKTHGTPMSSKKRIPYRPNIKNYKWFVTAPIGATNHRKTVASFDSYPQAVALLQTNPTYKIYRKTMSYKLRPSKKQVTTELAIAQCLVALNKLAKAA
jgi:hypothetical protein